MWEYPKAVSLGNYYTYYTLQTCQPHQAVIATFADDTAVLAMDSDSAIASQKL
jgi:hypothetical protein